MIALRILIVLGIGLILIRVLGATWFSKSQCPRCGHSKLSRIPRTTIEHLAGKVFFAPLRRYRCQADQCGWEGLAIYREKSRAQKSIRQKPIRQAALPANQASSFASSTHPSLATPTATSELLFSNVQIHRLLEKEEFIIHYQPIVNTKTKNIVGMEALLRWQHPEKGLLFPDQFIPNAEKSKLLLLVEKWAISKVILQAVSWQSQRFIPLTISINISSDLFYQSSFISWISEEFSKSHLNPKTIELEVSEKMLRHNHKFSQASINKLREVGIKVAVSELDTSNIDASSIKSLLQFSFDTLKINRSIMNQLTISMEEFEKISLIANLSERYDVDLVFEGIETADQLNTVHSLGCTIVQGYLFDKPLTEGDALDVLEANWLGRVHRIQK